MIRVNLQLINFGRASVLSTWKGSGFIAYTKGGVLGLTSRQAVDKYRLISALKLHAILLPQLEDKP
jgi:hypothetical protein